MVRTKKRGEEEREEKGKEGKGRRGKGELTVGVEAARSSGGLDDTKAVSVGEEAAEGGLGDVSLKVAQVKAVLTEGDPSKEDDEEDGKHGA